MTESCATYRSPALRILIGITWAAGLLLGIAAEAATYYWQDDSGTSVAGFTTDSTGCENKERDVFLTTLMSAGGFNCTDFRHEVRDPPPQNMWLMIKDTVYAVATDVTGIDFALNFLDKAAGGVTARYELGYAQGGVFTSWGFVDEGPHEAQATYVTDLSSISGTAPAGSHLALRISDVAPSPGDMRMFTGSDNSSGVLNVTETPALSAPDLTVMKFATTLEDPFNGTTDPKAIPRAIVLYTILVTNFGTGPADADSVTITDPIPANLSLRVTDYDGANPGPVSFVDGSPSSGLSYTFTSLGSITDDIEFSNDGGTTWTYTPVDSGDGTDPVVTDIHINPKEIFTGNTGSGDPSFQVLFKAVIQ